MRVCVRQTELEGLDKNSAVKKAAVQPLPVHGSMAHAVPPSPKPTVSSANHLAFSGPRPSPRLNLRAASLLPTLPTGASMNQMYMAARSRAIQLGMQRNVCLAKAAEAWRRKDGLGAKAFSQEGQALNELMAMESVEAAGKWVFVFDF